MYSRCLLLSLPAAPLTFAPHNKRAPLNALYGVQVGVLESCHLIGFEDFAIPQSPTVGRALGDALMDKPTTVLDRNTTLSHLHFDWMRDSGNFQDVYHIKSQVFIERAF